MWQCHGPFLSAHSGGAAPLALLITMAWRRKKISWVLKRFQKPLERKWVIFCFPEWFHWNLGKIIAVGRSRFLLFCSFFIICFHMLLFEYTSSYSSLASPLLPFIPYPTIERCGDSGRERKNTVNKRKRTLPNFLFQIQWKEFLVSFQMVMMAFYDQKAAGLTAFWLPSYFWGIPFSPWHGQREPHWFCFEDFSPLLIHFNPLCWTVRKLIKGFSILFCWPLYAERALFMFIQSTVWFLCLFLDWEYLVKLHGV